MQVELPKQEPVRKGGVFMGARGRALVWNTSHYTYDVAGYRIREKVTQTTSLSDGRWVDAIYQDNYLAYDALGRLRRVEDGRAVVNMEYDEVGNRTRIQTHVILSAQDGRDDVRDEDRYFRYDAMNRQTHVDVDAAGGLGNNGHAITYDLEGNRKIDASATLVNGQVVYRTDSYTYDAQQRLVDATRDGKVIDRRYYDKAGRVVENMAADGTEVRTSRYDGNGSLFQQRVYGRTVETGAITNKYDVNYTSYDNSGNVLSYQVWSFGSSMVSTTYTNTYQFFDSAKQASQHATSNPESNLQDGRTEWDYDKSGQLVGVQDLTKPENNRVFVNDANGNALYSSQGGHVQRQLIVNGEVLGRYGEARQGTQFQNVADFNFSYQAVDGNYPATAPTEYMVGAGNTLQSIAKAVYGDSRLWYLIAEANGLASDADLQAGQSLRIPPVVGTKYNSATDFKPYDPSQVIGDTTPHQTFAPPKKKRSLFGQLLAIVIAVIVTVYTAGALSAGFGGGFSSIMSAGVEALGAGISGGAVGLTGTTTLAGGGLSLGATGFAVTGAVGSVASQLVSVVAGVQDRFSWKGVALSALSAGVGAGVGQLAQGTALAGNGFGATVGRALIGNMVTQGVAVATGLQRSFNWAGVASAAVGAGVGQAVGSALGPNVPGDGMGPVQPAAFSDMGFAGDVLRGGISAFAGGLTTAVMRGGRVSVAQIAVDSFGNALGSSIAEAMSPSSSPYSLASGKGGPGLKAPAGTWENVGVSAAQQDGGYDDTWRSQNLARMRGLAAETSAGGGADWSASTSAMGAGPSAALPSMCSAPQLVGSGRNAQGRDYYEWDSGAVATQVPSQSALIAQALAPLQLGGMKAGGSWVDQNRASDQAMYNGMIANANNPVTAIAATLGRPFNNAFYDIAGGAVGFYSLATDRDVQSRTLSAAFNAITHPIDTGKAAYNAGAKYLSNTSGAQMAEDALRFGAGGFATAGLGKGATALGGVALDGVSATGQWLAPKAAQMAESYLARTGGLVYAVEPGGAAANRGLIFVGENLGKPSSPAMQIARDFESATSGAFSDIATQQRVVPALRFENPNANGTPFVKFDSHQALDNGLVELIDAKTRIVPFANSNGPFISSSVRDGLVNKSLALAQNPGHVGVIELPTIAARREAQLVLRQLGINNITTRVR